VAAALGLCLAGILATAMALALRGAPAFDETARRTGAFGDWRVPDSHALYSRPDYLFQLAFGYLQADAIPSAATEGEAEVAPLETALRRAATARDLLEETIALAPASARAWVSLAWARALLGEFEGAREALRVSRTLAPHNLGLAGQRVALGEVLAVTSGTGLDDDAAEGLARDMNALDRFGAAQLEAILGGG